MDFQALSERLKDAPDSGYNGQMPLATLKDQNKSLSVPEILHLLRTKVVGGRELPSQLNAPPWRIPTKSHPKSSQINAVLSKSMEVQSSHVPDCHGHGDFQDFILSNASLAVAGLLKTYLSGLGLANDDEVGVVFGVMLWDPSARDGPDDYEGTPHIWLNVAGNDIDNANIAFPESDAAALEYFYKAKSSNSYRREDPLKTRLKLYLGQETSAMMADGDGDKLHRDMVHNLKLFREYTTGSNVEKFLVFNLHFCDLNPTVKMYDILMREFIANQFPETKLENLEAKWSKMCWSCCKPESELCQSTSASYSDTGTKELKSCTQCKLAKYCDKECQKCDWKVHKLLHKELERTRHVLAST